MKNKIIKHIKLGLAGLVLASSLNGCGIAHLMALKKYNPLTKENILFSELNPGLKEYINKVYIIDKKDFFEKNLNGHAHTLNRKQKNNICLTKEYLRKEIIFHEAAHVRFNGLNESKSDFSKKWGEIADFKYGKENMKTYNLNSKVNPNKFKYVLWRDDKTTIPKNGLLTPYSAKSISEDVAVFIECISFANEKESANKTIFPELFPLFFADTTDHRYRKKLDLLKEYNFLTKEEHKTSCDNLGIYYHLLKNK